MVVELCVYALALGQLQQRLRRKAHNNLVKRNNIVLTKKINMV